MRIIGEMAKILAFLVWLFHVFFPVPRCILLSIFTRVARLFARLGEKQKNDGHPPPQNTERKPVPVPNFAPMAW